MKKYFPLLTILLLINNLTAQNNPDVLWSFELQQPLNISPVFNDDKIIVATAEGTIICLNKNGEENWQYDLKEQILQPPIINNDLLFAATEDGEIISLNANTGDPFQELGIGESITSGLRIVDINSPFYNSAGVIAATGSGNIFCYDISTFESLWSNQVSDTSITSPIVSYNHQIFFMDGRGNLYCISADKGLLIWKITSEEFGWKTIDHLFKTDILLTGNSLYLTDYSGKLFCIDAMLGTINWSIKNNFSTGIIRLNDKNELVIPTSKNKIIIVSPSQRKVLKEIELPAELKNENIADLLVINGKIIIGFASGTVYQIDTKGKAELILNGTSSVVSLLDVDGDCLVSSYDGNIWLLNINE